MRGGGDSKDGDVVDFPSRLVDFCGLLRAEHGFRIGPAEMRDGLRAVELVGIEDPERVRDALRLVLCGSQPEVAAFDRAFDAFFLGGAGGRPQPRQAFRAVAAEAPPRSEQRSKPSPGRTPKGGTAQREPDDSEPALGRRVSLEGDAGEASARTLRAQYSPAVSGGGEAHVDREARNAMLAAAGRLVAGVRLGPARRWRSQQNGPRFDLRRTLRSSLGTGGDPMVLKWLGHPPRSPRFAVLVDGSRSMAEHATMMLAFAQALTRRTSRARVYLFSTELREITRDLRRLEKGAERLDGLREAWGGGTRIGASLQAFVRGAGGRALSDDTLAIVFSDGLDAGDIDQLRGAMRAIARRAAAIVWLNPHAGLPGYEPTARGMQAALPYIRLFAPATDVASMEALAKTLAGRLWPATRRPLQRARTP